MIENFETVKQQLSELAGVINLFKSESVQLRIIELIWGAPQETPPGDQTKDEKPPQKKKQRSRKPKQKATDEKPAATKRKMSGGTGAVATLTQLAEGDFFDTPKTIGDIIQHCKDNLARQFKANEFSGKLSRMIRNEELTREKNADSQYEYTKA